MPLTETEHLHYTRYTRRWEDSKEKGVAKGVGLQNPLRELDNLENAAYTIAYYWNNKQRDVKHIATHKDNEKSNGIFGQAVLGNGVVPHYHLQPNKFQICLVTPHTCQSDTRATCKHQNHRCNTILPLVHCQSSVESLLGFAPIQLPNPKYSVFCDLQSSEYRSCFFITNECKQLVHLGILHFIGHRSGR